MTSQDNIVPTTLELFPLLNRNLMRFSGDRGSQVMVPAHVQLLVLISKEKSIPVSELGKKLNIAKSNMTPLISRLVNDGYIERTANPRDRRAINISITPQGRKCLNVHTEKMIRYFSEKLSLLSIEEVKRFEESLLYVKDVLNKLEHTK